MLDPYSLINATQVSRKWREVCRGDPQLRATARRHIRREKRRTYGLAGKSGARSLKKTPLVTSVSPVPSMIGIPVIFTFGPSGICAGQPKTKTAKRRVRPPSRTGMVKNMLKFSMQETFG
ncbi:uncharacterized protein [Fopius arisanus]|uniref:Uncharacterized protein isoform X2 n=1 Tax=Fopius arisanus TaxID=64838 RepID=A0A9R1TF04_9HYME|nr:PREDICTED: uncharacterized protein LOC105269370 isoform X2 [Fopius arisanus]